MLIITLTTPNGICKMHHKHTKKKKTTNLLHSLACYPWFPAYYKLHMLFRVRLLVEYLSKHWNQRKPQAINFRHHTLISFRLYLRQKFHNSFVSFVFLPKRIKPHHTHTHTHEGTYNTINANYTTMTKAKDCVCVCVCIFRSLGR